MDFDLNETQKLFQTSARDFFAAECPPARVREMIDLAEPYSESLWAKLAEQGWTGLIFPEDIGGMGLTTVELAVACEEMGRALAPTAFLSTVALAGSLLQSADSPQHRDYLESICEGRKKGTLALLEETASWDPADVRLVAVESGQQIKLTGRKLFVTDAAESDFIIVAAYVGSTMTLMIIDAESPGMAIRHMPSLDFTRNLYEVVFEDLRLPSSSVIARGELALKALDTALDIATLAVSAEMVGGMHWILETSVEYAKTRKQFGKPIGQFQAVQHHCADMLLLTESARSAVYYAAWTAWNEPERARLAVSIAKSYAADAFREVGNRGIQVHGGIGFTWDENLHFHYRRAKASEILFGDPAFHRERIARLVVDPSRPPEARRASD